MFYVIKDLNASHVIDKNKIRREKKNINAELCTKSDVLPLLGLNLDRRKDYMFLSQAHSKRYLRSVKEEHYSLIQESGSLYVEVVTPNSGSSEDILSLLTSYLPERSIYHDNLTVIGCNGTAVNIGWKTGLIRRVELYLGKPLQFAICRLHFNKQPFRHLFLHLDGKTMGPSISKGAIGKKLVDCEKLLVVNFQSIDCQIRELDRKVLSNSQQFFC